MAEVSLISAAALLSHKYKSRQVSEVLQAKTLNYIVPLDVNKLAIPLARKRSVTAIGSLTKYASTKKLISKQRIQVPKPTSFLISQISLSYILKRCDCSN
ncbi:hypothetical protein L9F63_010787, partial [Diploptera punctata]